MRPDPAPLYKFIRENMDAILQKWDDFAHSLLPECSLLSELALRDHAEQILRAIALDIEARQTPQQQADKSQGRLDTTSSHKTAASIHGALRHESRFTLIQLSAEYRALRASVLRLWLPTVGALSSASVDSMVRFNEAIDQADPASFPRTASYAASRAISHVTGDRKWFAECKRWRLYQPSIQLTISSLAWARVS